jgi:hypothetical protein
MADTFWGDAAEDMHKTAQAKAKSFENHPSAIHFKNAVKHYKKAVDAYHSGADDQEVVNHWDRGDKHMAKGEKMTLENIEETEVDEALVSKATLERYRAKSKAKFREKGGISAALDKQDKDKEKKVEVRKEEEEIDELSKGTLGSYVKKAARQSIATAFIQGNNRHDDLSNVIDRAKKLKKRERGIGKAVDKITKEDIEPLDELSRKTLKSYTKKATTSAQRAWDKGDKEEDKSMSTDGNKYPEKQARHQAAAQVQHKKWAKRDKGLGMAKKKLKESIVDLIMVNDENESSAYIAEIEARCDFIVSEIKDEMRKMLFDFGKGK